MRMNSVIALGAAAIISLATLPAFAQPIVVPVNDAGIFGDGGPTDSSVLLSKAGYIARLHAQGVDATSVEQWGPYLRAFVKDANGHSAMKLFDPNTLQPVTL
ncbi:MAG TPA: hypothetical protein VIL84_09830 [Devosiaceae bacterium]